MLSVREIQPGDVDLLCNYWFNSSEEHLRRMGADIKKLPSREAFTLMLNEQIHTPAEQKKSYCVIWLNEGKPVGHSNTNPTQYGEEAAMHLHLWNSDSRKKGMGTQFLQMTLKLYFENLKLKKLLCEPYALNPAPNKILEKTGFSFVKEYVTIPGSITFEQPVKRWEMTRETFLAKQSQISL